MEFIYTSLKAQMLALCGHTWQTKPENQKKTNVVLDANPVSKKCVLTTILSRPPVQNISFPSKIIDFATLLHYSILITTTCLNDVLIPLYIQILDLYKSPTYFKFFFNIF